MAQEITYTRSSNIFFDKFKFKQTGLDNGGFIPMKEIVGRDVLVSYPNFSEIFIICTDSSKIQLGGVINLKCNPVGFHSRNLTPTQMNYTII